MEISLLEFIVYGIFAYGSLVMLLISTQLREPPTVRSGSIVRAMWFIPGVICNFILMGSGLGITTERPAIILGNTTITNETNQIVFTEITNSTIIQPAMFTLQNPIWPVVHLLFGLTLIAYIIFQMLYLFTKSE